MPAFDDVEVSWEPVHLYPAGVVHIGTVAVSERGSLRSCHFRHLQRHDDDDRKTHLLCGHFVLLLPVHAPEAKLQTPPAVEHVGSASTPLEAYPVAQDPGLVLVAMHVPDVA